MAGFQDISKPYKEKKWYKPNNGGENITTGYSLRGRQRLKTLVEGLIKVFERGVNKTIEGVQINTLDARKVGVALEIEVAMVEKGESGIAMLKLYGPYSQEDKKDNVILISKSKHNEEKFVTILAEQIIKPLIANFVREENDPIGTNKIVKINSVSVKGREIKLLKCPHCEKTSYSSKGLKGHITKMHNNSQPNKEKVQKEEIDKEENKSIQDIFDDKFESGETINLEESSSTKARSQDTAENDEYEKKCDTCMQLCVKSIEKICCNATFAKA